MASLPFGIPRTALGPVVVAFGTFFGVLAGHSMLETARDAMFLSALPPERLPWVYLAIAGLSVVVARFNRVLTARVSKRHALAATLVGSSAVTAGFWFWSNGGVAALYAFYVWTGLVATIAVVQLWLLIGEELDQTQARRVFGFIAAGGLIGATFGSAVAGALLRSLPPRHLIVVASLLLAASGLLPALAWRAAPAPEPRRSRRSQPSADPTTPLRHPYLRRLLVLVMLTQVAVTSADLLFKAKVADTIPMEDLGEFFALFYTALNALSLMVQVLLAGWLLRRLGVSRALWVLPLLVGASVLGFGLTAALAPILLGKVFDGLLRHSLHKTGIELLYLPLPSRLRERHKVAIDAVGARGGQAVASVIMLGALSLGAALHHIALGLVGLFIALVWSVADIKRHYVQLFRDQLREGTIETRAEMPELDLHSLEALVAGMSSTDDVVAIAALDLLHSSGRAKLVPSLILYHPSRDVVLRALAILGASHRTDFLPVARRLLQSIDPEVRAAALRAVTGAGGPAERAVLREALADPSPVVRATVVVGLFHAGGDDDEVRGELERLAGSEDPATRIALARAIREHPGPAFHDVLRELAATRDSVLMTEVARTIAAAPDPSFIPLLLPMLADQSARPDARHALFATGAAALAALDGALGDASLPRRVRLHLPRTISRFRDQAAADVLAGHLERELDTSVGYKILRGLGRMVADNRHIEIDRRLVERCFRTALCRAITVTDWRLGLKEEIARRDPGRAPPPSGLLLAELLREREGAALERAFRLLGLLHPEEDFHAIYAGLRAGSGRMASSSRELIEYLVEPKARAAILALLEGGVDDRQRVERAGLFYRPEARTHAERLRAMLADPNDVLSGLAAQYVAEGGLGDELGGAVRERLESRAGRWTDLVDQAVHVLRGGKPEVNPVG